MSAEDLGFMGCRPAGEPVHLGDGAYAQFDGYHIRLRANHHDPRHCMGEVALDPRALVQFIRFAKEYWKI